MGIFQQSALLDYRTSII